jgi:antibiotic biosynthesis monooxygenase (ABM) superfamily enzyme
MCTRLLRFDGEQTLPGDADSPANAGGLLVNAMNVAPEHEAEFNEWYDNEHVPALAAVPGVLSARRFKDPTGTHRYLALYHLKTPDVTTGQAWKSAASTPWTERLRPHFKDHLRILSRRYIRGA